MSLASTRQRDFFSLWIHKTIIYKISVLFLTFFKIIQKPRKAHVSQFLKTQKTKTMIIVYLYIQGGPKQ